MAKEGGGWGAYMAKPPHPMAKRGMAIPMAKTLPSAPMAIPYGRPPSAPYGQKSDGHPDGPKSIWPSPPFAPDGQKSVWPSLWPSPDRRQKRNPPKTGGGIVCG
jgi:hypothetical protein